MPTVNRLALSGVLAALLLVGCGGGSNGDGSSSSESTNSAVKAAKSEPPSDAQVAAVVECISKSYGAIGNFGLDPSYGQPHVVLLVTTAPAPTKSSYRVEVFSSSAAAKAALPQATKYFADTKAPVEISGNAIVAASFKDADPSALPKIEACLD